MKDLKSVVSVLLIVGGLNWGLVGLLNVDIVAAILGAMSTLSRIVYILVGLAGVYSVWMMVSKPK